MGMVRSQPADLGLEVRLELPYRGTREEADVEVPGGSHRPRLDGRPISSAGGAVAGPAHGLVDHLPAGLLRSKLEGHRSFRRRLGRGRPSLLGTRLPAGSPWHTRPGPGQESSDWNPQMHSILPDWIFRWLRIVRCIPLRDPSAAPLGQRPRPGVTYLSSRKRD